MRKIKLQLKSKAGGGWLYIDEKNITPDRSLELVNHSPDGFAWGYLGSGPAQLALAICLEIYEEPKALAYYQLIKETLVAQLDGDQDHELELWFDESEPLVWFEEPPLKSYQMTILREMTVVVQGRSPGEAVIRGQKMEVINENDVIKDITDASKILKNGKP